MRKTKIVIISLVVTILLFILIIFILLSRQTISNTNNNPNNNTYNISYPISFPTTIKSFNSRFYEGYQNDRINLSSSFALRGNDISRYSSYNFTIDNSIPFQMILVNSSSFKNQEDLYQRMYMYESPTGNFIEKYNYEEDNLKLDIAIMEPAIGGKSYMLVGGVIDGSKGYYFKTMIGEVLKYNITAERISNIVKFNDERNPHIIFDLIQKFKSEDIPSSYFSEFVPNIPEVDFSILGKGNFDLPVYQDRN